MDYKIRPDGPRCDAFDAGTESSSYYNLDVSLYSRWYNTKWGDARSGAIPHQLYWIKLETINLKAGLPLAANLMASESKGKERKGRLLVELPLASPIKRRRAALRQRMKQSRQAKKKVKGLEGEAGHRAYMNWLVLKLDHIE